MDTTKANVLLIAPELTSMPTDLWTLILADVVRQVTYQSYGANEEEAQRYLVAHYMTVLKDINAGTTTGGSGSGAVSGVLTKAKTEDLEASYADLTRGGLKDFSRYDLTAYGRHYMTIRKRSIIRARVFTPC